MNRTKTLLIIFGLLLYLLPVRAQELLNEGFESGEFPDNGWSAIHDPNPEVKGHWRADNYAVLTGKFNLYIDEYDSPAVEGVTRKKEVKKEYAITPSITLPTDKSYGIQFLWVAQSLPILTNPGTNFMVGVQEEGETEWTTIWAANDRESIERSGVKFPWVQWARNLSTVSLKDYKGKTIKVAFIYDCFDANNGSMVRMDNVVVLPHEAIEGPVVSGTDSYTFTDAYIGLRETSEPQALILTNSGIGQLEITAIEGLDGTDFSTNLKPGIVTLEAMESVTYDIYYTPTEEGARNTELLIKTNGGDLKVALSGTKVGLDPGYSVESFEGNDFYPIGWTGKGFRRANTSRSGDYAATVTLESEATLISPRLNVASGNHKIVFDLNVLINEESEYEPEDKFYLQQSKNGGNSWTTIWEWQVSPTYENTPYHRISININNPFSDNFLLRWVYKLDGELSFERECQNFYIDNIVLPPLHGSDGLPEITTMPTPADNAINQYVNDLQLKWRGALHAEGYKIYLGTDASNPNSILDGERVGRDVNTYTINGLDYNTKYYWKVVPFNAQGSAANPQVWNFTTMADMSIKKFPHHEGFEGEVFPPVGWVTRTDGYGNWSTVGYKPYEGEKSLAALVTQNNTGIILETPEIIVPEDMDIQITFAWGNAVPAGLEKSTSNVGGDSIYFEARTPDTDWETLAFCSQEEPKWEKAKVLLNKYKGKRLTLRWRYHAINALKANRGALDDITISYVSSVGVPVIEFKEWYNGRIFIRNEWNAGVVNYREVRNSGEMFTLRNEGEHDLKIKSISFDTEFFTTTLAAGQVIKANEETKFGIIFQGVKEQPEIIDAMSIEFEDGQTYDFPITGSALGEFSYCYTFDDLEPFITNNIYDFKLVDEDSNATFDNSGIRYPGKGSPYAFMVMNWEQADWRDLYPRSGQHMIMAANAPIVGGKESELRSSDWLISKQLSPREDAQLRFYAKSYANMEDWQPHKLSVKVSTTDDKTSSFTVLPDFNEIVVPCYTPNKEQFMEFKVDLGEYVGEKIYVAIHHTSYKGMVMFIDDIYFENFNGITTPGEGAPMFVSEPVKTGQVGKEYYYAFTVMDPDGDHLNYTVRKPAWMNYTQTDNGGVLSGIPNIKGEHYVRIEATDGKNTTIQEFDIVVEDSNNIDNIANDIKIFPNPATDIVYINGSYSGNVTLTDLSGTVLFKGSNVREIPLNNLAVGVYLLHLETETSVYKTKIIKR